MTVQTTASLRLPRSRTANPMSASHHFEELMPYATGISSAIVARPAVPCTATEERAAGFPRYQR